MRLLLLLTIGFATAQVSADAATPVKCAQSWLFFDTGNTLIDTSDWENLRYMPGALDYLGALRKRGYRLGLIVNIPERWGRTRFQKIRKLKSFIAETWREPRPFVWSTFKRVLIPMKDSERKPEPVLFEQAMRRAGGCPAVYQGEDAQETAAAERAGLGIYQVGVPGRPFFMPLQELPTP